MEITLKAPKVQDERFNMVIQFLQMAFQGNPEARNYAQSAVDLCISLQTDYPEDPAIWHVFSFVSGILNNVECARYFLAKTILLSEDGAADRASLGSLMDGDLIWPNTDAYIEASKSLDGLLDHYKDQARTHFDQGDMLRTDMCCQRISALGKPAMTQLDHMQILLDQTAERQKQGSLNAQYEDTIATLGNYWSNYNVGDLKSQLAQYAETPDRAQFADIVSAIVETKGKQDGVVLEVGCFAGYNLNAARERLSQETQNQTRFIGIEPNANVVAQARTLYPEVEFLVGDHEALVAGDSGAPDHIDVCTISRVLMVIMPEGVEKLLTYLAPRTDTLVICDDIFNVDGEQSVVRTPPNLYLVHNFRAMLEHAGFSIEDVIMAEVPDRECTGFIIAKGQD